MGIGCSFDLLSRRCGWALMSASGFLPTYVFFRLISSFKSEPMSMFSSAVPEVCELSFADLRSSRRPTHVTKIGSFQVLCCRRCEWFRVFTSRLENRPMTDQLIFCPPYVCTRLGKRCALPPLWREGHSWLPIGNPSDARFIVSSHV